MLLAENYFSFMKDISNSNMEDYDVVGLDDFALIPRKASVSDNSSNSIYSHDSGHDSYLEDGTGYSGDDEETVQCDICTFARSESHNKRKIRHHHRRSNRPGRRRKKIKMKNEREEREPVILRDLPKNDNFEFEDEKQVELRWTLEYFIDASLLPRLKRVVIDRGRPEDLGIDNLMVFDESAKFCESQRWRQNILLQLSERNRREIKDFNLLPTYLSCNSCTQLRQAEVRDAVCHGKSLKLSADASQMASRQIQERKNSDSCFDMKWRKQILYDLKMNNCKNVSNMKSVKRIVWKTTKRSSVKEKKKFDYLLDSVEEEGWEVYDIISDEAVY